MLLAINFSPAAARLVKSGTINVDYFKTPDWDWIIAEAQQIRPVAVHFTLEVGNNSLAKVDWDKVQQLADVTGTPYINLHLDAKQCYYPDLAVDTTNEADTERMFNTIFSEIMVVKQRFSPARVIIENSPYQARAGNTMLWCVEPWLIRRLISETGCGLLLDISHAVVTAKHLGMDPKDYISQLPVQKIRELHFAGVHDDQVNGGWVDHLSIQSEDWRWLDWALECIQLRHWSSPWLLSFEYGGVGEPFEWRSDPGVISAQVPELYEHIRAHSN